MGDIDFEEQLELERLEKEKRAKDGHPPEKVDPDGTVYEWDYDKKAWFPKIDAAFIAQYQMNYGVDTGTSESTAGHTQADQSQQNYQDYYNYAQQSTGESQTGETTMKTGSESSQEEYTEDSAEVMAKYTEDQKKHYNEYWSYYYNTDYHDFYTDCMAQYKAGNQEENQTDAQHEMTKEFYSEWNLGDNPGNQSNENNADNKDKGKKAKKRKQPQPKREEGWFKVEQKDNTNIYVSGLPPDITQEEFQELMAKYGLIMFDPRTKKPKAKLYVDEKGQPKGDGRCCYIKRESVDLCLNLLDGLDLRGHTIKAEMASFEMKGNYDPSKKKKKLSNKEKNRLRERQSKLFDWRPDKPRNAREKHEKMVVLKNIFDAKVFEDNPALINKVSADIRTSCDKYGSVKKVVVYDRHQDGVVIVHFKEPEEADKCVEYMNRRFIGDRRIIAEIWDGQTKYEVAETEAEREARLSKWEQYLDTGGEEDKTISGTSSSSQTAENGSSANKISDSDTSAKATIETDGAETKKESQEVESSIQKDEVESAIQKDEVESALHIQKDEVENAIQKDEVESAIQKDEVESKNKTADTD